MSIINRYIFFQFFPPFLIGYGFFTLVLMIPTIEKLVGLSIEKGIPTITTIELFLYAIPFVTVLTAPMGVLFSGLLTLGRLSSDNEIIALRANGFSVLKISFPAFLYGTIMSIFMLWFMNFVYPETNYRYQLLTVNASFANPSIFLENKDFKEIPDTNKKITSLEYDQDTQFMRDVYLYEKNDKEQISMIYAKTGQWINNEINSKNVKLDLSDGEIINFDVKKNEAIDFSTFEKLQINLQNQITQYENLERGLRTLGALEVRKDIIEKEKKNQPIDPVVYVEYHKKISLPIACVFFMFVAIPLSISLNNRSGKGISFGIALVVIFIYYVFLVIGETLGKKAIIPPEWGMHLPNAVLFILGSFFFIKIIRK